MRCRGWIVWLLAMALMVIGGIFLRDVHHVTQERIISLKKDVVQAVQERDELRRELEKVNKLHSEHLNQAKSVEIQTAQLQSEKESLTKQVQEMRSQLNMCKEGESSSQSVKDKLDRGLQECHRELNSIKEEISREKMDKSEMKRQSDIELQNVKTSVELCKQETQKLKADAENAEKVVADLNQCKGHVEQLQKELLTAKESMNQAAGQKGGNAGAAAAAEVKGAGGSSSQDTSNNSGSSGQAAANQAGNSQQAPAGGKKADEGSQPQPAEASHGAADAGKNQPNAQQAGVEQGNQQGAAGAGAAGAGAGAGAGAVAGAGATVGATGAGAGAGTGAAAGQGAGEHAAAK